MLTRLPELIDPILLAERSAEFAGQIPLAYLDRLTDLLAETEGSVDVGLVFSKQGGQAKIEGRIAATISLICQRCLQPVAWQVNKEIKLGIVNSLEQADKIPAGYEPLLLADEDKIPLKNIIEDELLLSIPDVPKHREHCRLPDIPGNKVIESENNACIPTRNPFSILADLKKTGDKNGSTKK
jgi:uncharacterized protein